MHRRVFNNVTGLLLLRDGSILSVVISCVNPRCPQTLPVSPKLQAKQTRVGSVGVDRPEYLKDPPRPSDLIPVGPPAPHSSAPHLPQCFAPQPSYTSSEQIRRHACNLLRFNCAHSAAQPPPPPARGLGERKGRFKQFAIPTAFFASRVNPGGTQSVLLLFCIIEPLRLRDFQG